MADQDTKRRQTIRTVFADEPSTSVGKCLPSHGLLLVYKALGGESTGDVRPDPKFRVLASP